MFQKKLKEEGIKFEAHKSIICCQPDLFIKPNICIFCDGDWWHSNPKKCDLNNLHNIQKRNKRYDMRNERILKKKGFLVLRFWESDIKEDINSCFEELNKFLIKLRLEAD